MKVIFIALLLCFALGACSSAPQKTRDDDQIRQHASEAQQDLERQSK